MGQIGVRTLDADPSLAVPSPRMELLRQLPSSSTRRAAVAFGNFDGVHLGHRALIAAVRREAALRDGPATVVTFEPHPLRLLRPELAPPVIDPLPVRLRNSAARLLQPYL